MAGGDYKDCDICWNCLDTKEQEQIIFDWEHKDKKTKRFKIFQ